MPDPTSSLLRPPVLENSSGLKGSSANLQPQASSQDHKLASIQANLEKRRSLIDARHRYLLEKFTIIVDTVSMADLETALLTLNKLDLLADFFKENGSKKVFMFWQACKDELSPFQSKAALGKPTLVVTDGSVQFGGVGCYFFRTNLKAITAATVHNDVMFGVLDKDILPSLTLVLKQVILPSLKAQDSWGVMSRATESSAMHEHEVNLEKLVDDLDVAVANIHSRISLKVCPVDLSAYQKVENFGEAVHHPEIISALELLVADWCKQIENVLAESEQFRREADESGPEQELDHWKSRMIKFTSITEQFKGPTCSTVVGILLAVKSKNIVKQWKDLEVRIVDASNESTDNLKYLYSLEKFYKPLYCNQPTSMMATIPGLLNSIKMIYRVSRYYNTSERVTSLFVKISNQLISGCKEYLKQPTGSNKILEVDRKVLVAKLKECIHVNECFQSYFHQTKEELSKTPNERQFDFSEMYIFGKFDSFCKRLTKLLELCDIIDRFSALEEVHVEGLDSLCKRFRSLFAVLQKKPYDMLDQRKNDFDNDYGVFKKSVQELEINLQEVVDKALDNVTSTEQALDLIDRFSQIKGMHLDLDSKYHSTFSTYTRRDLDGVRKLFEKYKENPPAVRDTPQVAAAIMWARQLYHRIEGPMMVFQEQTRLLDSEDSKRYIRHYNKIARVLVEYEQIWYQAWLEIVEPVLTGLQATLLVNDADNNVVVNFDMTLVQLMKESKALARLDMQVPAEALELSDKEDYYRIAFNRLVTIIRDKKSLADSLPTNLRRCLAGQFDELNQCLEPGLISITWTSMNLDVFIQKNEQLLMNLKELVHKLLDIISLRISGKITAISQGFFVDLPGEDETWDVETFLSRNETKSAAVIESINASSNLIQTSAIELVSEIDAASGSRAKADAKALQAVLYEAFNLQLFEAIVTSSRVSLDALKGRLAAATNSRTLAPPIRSDLVLKAAAILLNPKPDEIQSAISKVAIGIVDISRRISNWPSFAADGAHAIDFGSVGANKDVAKVVTVLSGILNSSKKDIEVYKDIFTKYAYLWRDEKSAVIMTFLNSNPSINDFEAQINTFGHVEKEIMEIGSTAKVGALAICLDQFKSSLVSEIAAWKKSYATNLNEKVRKDMINVVDYIETQSAKLSRKVVDIEDLRNIVQVLSEIREAEVDIDMRLQPIEEAYILLNKNEASVTREESEMVDSLRYRWKKLRTLVLDVQENLAKIQPVFKADLVANVKKFKNDVNDFSVDYEKNGPMVANIPPKIASERLNVFQRNFDEMNRKWEAYSAGEELFAIPLTEFPQLVKAKKELKLLQALYSLYNDVLSTRSSFYEMLWVDVNFEKMNGEMNEFQNKIKKIPKAVKEWDAFTELKTVVDDLTAIVPLLELMSNKALQMRHWDAIMVLTKTKFNMDPDVLVLKSLLDAPLLKFREDIEEICIGAVKEADIEKKLKIVVGEWEEKTFEFSQFKNRGSLTLKPSSTTEIISSMEDSLMVLSSLLSNRYNAPFKPEIQSWVQKLSSASEIIESWMAVQNLWIYLEAVFVGGDISKQMPKEAKRFQNIDKSWCKIMQNANEHPNVVHCCVADESIISLLPYLTEQLEMCQKSLSGYLESKRAIFPRFYFVSDPALLEILGQASDCHSIQAHLKSVFDNIQSVKFHDKEYEKIIALESSEGEVVPLSKPVMASGNVELWLGTLLQQMQFTVNSIIREGSSKMNDMPLLKFIDEYPAQIGLLGVQMQFTQMAEEALNAASSDKKMMSKTLQRVTDVLNSFIDVTTKDLSKMDRIKYETLVTIQVHHRDVFEKMVKTGIKTVDDFEWLKQCRFYWRETQDCCVVSITNFDFTYQCEYLGCTDRLVITPLTDRCFITLAQAIGMSLGGSPAGPAGTGKTETTKDMGKALGKWVVVFNCSDQMDYRGLGKIFKGLAQSGNWGCFDEFNRIELPVLSVAAQQIGCVFAAKRERKKNFVFTDGETVELNQEVAYFITMNPGYAGRVELPENLKVHFRYVAMMVPNREIIIRVKLAGCGFQNNIILARKFFVLYGLCEQQLSKQVHYDFGLRNILSVLRSCGAVKRSSPQDSEALIIMRVLRDMNVSKLVDEDEILFMSLINDLFPGLSAPKGTYPTIEAAIEQQVNEAGLINYAPWNLKVIQLYETCKVRHGIMVLGPTGTGKTKCINTLLRAFTACGDPHKELRMNPKAITDYQMFGRLDVTTNDWTDGIFSALWRKTIKKKGEYVWILLDGPVDAVWIENLNSVLDDNKTLTLANGDRLTMSPTCKLVFEVDSLRNASPATVSRCGMIFLGMTALKWEICAQAWLKTRSAQEVGVLDKLIESTFGQVYTFLSIDLHPKMEISANSYIANLTVLLDGLIPKGANISDSHLQKLYTFAFFWTVGSLLELDERKKLQAFMVKTCPSLPYPPVKDDSTDTIYEFFVSDDGNWMHWNNKVFDYKYPADISPAFSSIIVPTVDNVRSEFLIETVAKQGKGVLLIGEPGTAKTTTIQRYIAKLNPEVHSNKGMNFSSATTPNIFQRSIESYIDKRMGSTYGPPAGKKMTIFIDDINMPEINDWGDQVTSEIVRQLIEYQGFFSLDRPGEWNSVVDLQFLGAMPHPGAGRNDIPPRLKRHFFILNTTIPSDVSVDRIFATMLTGHFCKERGFSDEVVNTVSKLAGLTRKLWQQTKTKMLPTPAKFHYIFNLRDLSRIVEGMLKGSAEVICDKNILMNLWEHECSRVIPDRFTISEDTAWFFETLKSLVAKDMGPEYAAAVSDQSFFVDFMRDPPEVEDPDQEIDPEKFKIYEKVPSFDVLRSRLNEFMRQYNESIRGAKMDLVLFEDAMKHIVRISRILRTPRGNALLVGVGGSGKQSLTKLASFIAGNKIFQIAISKSYNTSNLMEDLKGMYKIAGASGKPVTFIFTDNEVKEESFLGYINNIMTSGEVANLFPKDEVISIGADLRNVMKKQRPNVVDTVENLWRFFIDRVKDNLHIVLCFSPVGEKFRNRSLKFPGLISGCTMDWFTRWPKEALEAVAEKFVGTMDIACEPQVKTEVVKHMAFVHDLVHRTCLSYFTQFRRRTHVTPKSYLSFINSYLSMYQSKRKYVGEMADRMNMGLEKLLEAQKSVAQLQKELVVKEKDLVIASKDADVVLAEVTSSTTAAEKVKDSVLKVKVKAEAIANSILADKAIAEGQLEAAKPALEEAANALNSIMPQHIATIRKLAKPPHLIMRIMDGVLLLQKKKIDPVTQDPEKNCIKPSWSESLRLMSQSDFLTSLLNFAKDEINEETCELLEPYLEMPDFNLEGAKKVSGDVAGLASWVRAMYTYFGINKFVIPLKANLIIQERKLEIATNDLKSAQAILDDKQAELDAFKAKYNQAIATKQALQDDADTCKRKMSAATALINGLGGEKDRWTQTSKDLADQVGRLVGDVLVSSAFLSYAGPFNQTFRSEIIKAWSSDLGDRQIPLTKNLNLIDLLVDNTTIGEWNIQGLPTDELSTQNGILVTSGTRFPLLIDPQGQAKSWIKKREEQRQMQVTTLSHKYFRQHVEDCVSQGRPLLIEDVEEQLDPTLDNILEKNIIKSGKSFKVRYGDKEIDFADTFTLYLTTKLPNPDYSPEVYAKTSIVDFTVTSKGLEEQLLGRVIMREKQELETERAKMLEEINSNKKKMKELEDNLLQRLTSTKGSLVDDETLIEVLAITKTTAQEVSEKLVIAAETQKKISIAREEYRPVATRGSIIYFLIAEMSMVNCMYQTSLKQFLKLFDESMEKSLASPIPSKRIQNIIDFGTFSTFAFISRSFYEEHKLMFVLLLALKIDVQAGRITHEEFRCLIKGGAALNINEVAKKPFGWIPEMTWLNLVALSKMNGFNDLPQQIAKNERAWKTWYEKDSPESETFPAGYDQAIDNFKRLMLIRAWCLDRASFTAQQYIASSLGRQYAEAQILDFEALLNESDCRTPLIGLLSTGADPSADIESLAKRLKVECKNISMGQGQEVHARKLVTTFMATGGWALLQNCHLGISFMEELLVLLAETEVIHEKFRVWITTDVTPAFLINLLQISIKYTNEPPQGLRAGLKRTYNWFSQDTLDLSNRPQYKPLLYGVSFLHSVVQERRKFGPLGWNISYEFNQSDLATSVQFVQNHVDELQPRMPIGWVTVQYCLCEVFYGGRVTDDYDRRLINTYGKLYFGDHMFAESFSFSKGYKIPSLKTIEDFRGHIDTLPLADSPEAFGLHPNADISSQTKSSQRMLDTVMSIQPKDSNAGGGETREEAVKRIADDLLSKLPDTYDKNKVKAALTKLGAMKPLNIFLGQEVDRIQVVLKTCRSDLKDLKLAIDGTIIMSQRLQQALDALYDARVPTNWSKVSWPAQTLGTWFTEVLQRVDQYTKWMFEAKPTAFWLSGFFNPQGFLTAIRQEITRAHTGWALDSVRLLTEVTKMTREDVTGPPPEGVYIYGMFIEGAGWDRKNARLIESTPKVIYQQMPVIHVSATNTAEEVDSKIYKAPSYKRPRRTDLNYIFDVDLRTTQSPDYWIVRGVALMCATN